MTSLDRKAAWNEYSPSLRAILDEYSRAIDDLERIVGGLTPESYTATTSLSNDDYPDIQSIMKHAIAASFGYADYIDDALQHVDRGRRERLFDFTSPRTAMTSLWSGFDHMVDVLRQGSHLTDDDTIKIEFTTRWGEHYNMEQLLEHAICHILRHRRQIERWLAAM